MVVHLSDSILQHKTPIGKKQEIGCCSSMEQVTAVGWLQLVTALCCWSVVGDLSDGNL